MTWTEVINQIEVGLTSNGYIKQIENKEIDNPDSSNKYLDKGYSLKSIDGDYFQTTGLSAIASYGIELKISYLCLTDEEHQVNIDLFHTLLGKFTNKNPFTNFAGFTDKPITQYDDGDKSVLIGSIKMMYGFKGI